jgi:hypothetical protein
MEINMAVPEGKYLITSVRIKKSDEDPLYVLYSCSKGMNTTFTMALRQNLNLIDILMNQVLQDHIGEKSAFKLKSISLALSYCELISRESIPLKSDCCSYLLNVGKVDEANELQTLNDPLYIIVIDAARKLSGKRIMES